MAELAHNIYPFGLDDSLPVMDFVTDPEGGRHLICAETNANGVLELTVLFAQNHHSADDQRLVEYAGLWHETVECVLESHPVDIKGRRIYVRTRDYSALGDKGLVSFLKGLISDKLDDVNSELNQLSDELPKEKRKLFKYLGCLPVSVLVSLGLSRVADDNEGIIRQLSNLGWATGLVSGVVLLGSAVAIDTNIINKKRKITLLSNKVKALNYHNASLDAYGATPIDDI